MKHPEEPDPGEASLPEGWETLSWASRRELMRGARIPPPGVGLTRGDELDEFCGELNPEAPEDEHSHFEIRLRSAT